jgi:Glycosyltransferase family 9 (heptosyltransferase)
MLAYLPTEPLELNTVRWCRRYEHGPASGLVPIQGLYVDVPGEIQALRKAWEARQAGSADPRPLPIRLFHESELRGWESLPRLLGRRELGRSSDGLPLIIHEPAPLEAQLRALRDVSPRKRHIRLAILNGFGTNLGDALIGLSAMRAVVPLIRQVLGSFSCDALLGQSTSPFVATLFEQEDWLDRATFLGPRLGEFADYDAFFDFSSLIRMPRYDEMPSVDWYLWWLGVDPSVIDASAKRNRVRLDAAAWAESSHWMPALPGKRVLFNPKASVPLRTLGGPETVRLAKGLLDRDPTLNLVFDKPPPLRHERVHDLSAQASSPARLLALVARMDAVLSVDTFVLHAADALNVPCVSLFSSVPGTQYPYYPLNQALDIPGIAELPAYRRTKVGETEWAEIEPAYRAAWGRLKPAAVGQALADVIGRADRTRMAESSPQVGPGFEPRSCVLRDPETAASHFHREQPAPGWPDIEATVIAWARARVPIGAHGIVVGGAPSITMAVARRIGPGGRLSLFEPRAIVAQMSEGDLAVAGFTRMQRMNIMLSGQERAMQVPDLDPWSAVDPAAWGSRAVGLSVTCKPLDALRPQRFDILVALSPSDPLGVWQGGLQSIQAFRPAVCFAGTGSALLESLSEAIRAEAYDVNVRRPPASDGAWMLVGEPQRPKVAPKP